QGIVGIFPGFRISQYCANPSAQNISSTIGALIKTADKHNRRFKRFARQQPRTKRRGVWIESHRSAQRFALPFERNTRAPTEFDSHIPPALRVWSLHQRPGNDFAWLPFIDVPIGARSTRPAVAVSYVDFMRAHRRRLVRTFFNIGMLQACLRCDLPIKSETVLHRNPQFLTYQVFDSNLVLDRTVVFLYCPRPCESKPRTGRFVNESHTLGIGVACVTIKLPMHRRFVIGDFDRSDQRLGSTVLPFLLAGDLEADKARSIGASLKHNLSVRGFEFGGVRNA